MQENNEATPEVQDQVNQAVPEEFTKVITQSRDDMRKMMAVLGIKERKFDGSKVRPFTNKEREARKKRNKTARNSRKLNRSRK